jgi:hypothetical protein
MMTSSLNNPNHRSSSARWGRQLLDGAAPDPDEPELRGNMCPAFCLGVS